MFRKGFRSFKSVEKAEDVVEIIESCWKVSGHQIFVEIADTHY